MPVTVGKPTGILNLSLTYNSVNLMKKRIPLIVLEKINPLLSKYQDLFIKIGDPNSAVNLVDADADSDFFFKSSLQTTNETFDVVWKPANSSSVLEMRTECKLDHLTEFLRRWLDILNSYSEMETIFDDPIVERYKDEFYTELADPDDQKDPKLTPDQQKAIVGYLGKVQSLLPAYIDAADEQQLLEIKSIEREIASLNDLVEHVTKGQAMKKLSTIWAKAQKYSLTLIMEMLNEFKKEGGKMIARHIFDGSLFKSLDQFF